MHLCPIEQAMRSLLRKACPFENLEETLIFSVQNFIFYFLYLSEVSFSEQEIDFSISLFMGHQVDIKVSSVKFCCVLNQHLRH